MCQCNCCMCWWMNFMGLMCGGIHTACCCASCWICMPDDMFALNPFCCLCCVPTGIGANLCCFGNVCCAPDYLLIFSQRRIMLEMGMGMNMGMGGGTDVIVINSGPSYITDQNTPMIYNQGYNQGYAPQVQQHRYVQQIRYNQDYNQGYPPYNPNPGYNQNIGYNQRYQ